ncbi:rhomboid family intramembrane serine protease [Corynebacterium sp. 4HC-13]|uniref:rhomboid family intramembrane serine protease n=1 Tax=Corynebacterium anserum TaxID=2684406 RepID=UPI00163AAD33|nr:rhomboid family intramembrane serine protease [Corynebacterium anserum]MBC2681039.1 rhomboid family intramembrane serine protease [Corynebacterium anserum]
MVTRAGTRMMSALSTTVTFLVLIWAVQIVNALSGYRLTAFGIRPHDVEGIWGIMFAPIIHASFAHLIANTVVAAILLFIVALSGSGAVVVSTVMSMLVGGFGVWFFAQPYSVHVGSSILIYGWLAFLVTRGFFTGRIGQILVGIVVACVYGGMLWGVLPGQSGISWQGHLFGALGGIMAGWMSSGSRSH